MFQSTKRTTPHGVVLLAEKRNQRPELVADRLAAGLTG